MSVFWPSKQLENYTKKFLAQLFDLVKQKDFCPYFAAEMQVTIIAVRQFSS